MSENRVRVVAEYCPSCGEVHYPPPGKEGTGMVCTTCRYWQTHDRGEVLRNIIAEAEGARRNGMASDGRGWFRTDADRMDCYAVADAVLAALLDTYEIRERGQVSDVGGTCQETQYALTSSGSLDTHLHECVRERGHRSPVHRCKCWMEWWPVSDSPSPSEEARS